MKILIAGATGLIGRALGTALASQGHELIVLTRQADLQLPFPSEVVHWNEEQEMTSLSVLGPIDAVVNLAGQSIFVRSWDKAWSGIFSSRVKNTSRLIGAFQEAHGRTGCWPKVWINASAIGFYGDRGDEELVEQSTCGNDRLANLCVEWEKAAFEAHAVATAVGHSCRIVVMRMGLVLAGGGGALAQMLPSFRLGLGSVLGSGQQYVSWIHIDDLVRLLCSALLSDGWKGVVNAVSPGCVQNDEFSKTLAKVLNRPIILRTPKLLLKAILGDAHHVVLASQRVIPRKLNEQGFVFLYPTLEEAFAKVIVSG